MDKPPPLSHNPQTCAGVAEKIDPRIRRTRGLLADAFRALMIERAFASISVQDIAERATVNRATFYAHYAGKEELAASVLRDDLCAALTQRFSQCPTFTPDDLTTMAVAVFEFVERLHTQCPVHAAELQSVAGQALLEGLYEMVDTWLARTGGYRQRFPDTSRETIATVLSWGLYGGALRWAAAAKRTPAEPACREIAALFFGRS